MNDEQPNNGHPESSFSITVRGFGGLALLVRLAGGAGVLAAVSVLLDWTPEQIAQVGTAYGLGSVAALHRPKKKEGTS